MGVLVHFYMRKKDMSSRTFDLFDLAGKTALVTGASSGLGRHFAQVLAQAGAKVVLAARRMDELEKLAGEITAAGGQAMPVRLDVTDAAAVRAALDAGEARLGGIDILINNSGIAQGVAVLDQTEEDWDRVLDTNLKGAFLVATETARRMRDAKRAGSIVNIASILGLRQSGQVTAYAASKAGLIQMTKSMALELARYNIRVNALAPGYINTEMNRDFIDTPVGEALVRRIPQRRIGRPEDLDGALLLLASDASRYMTGAVIAVDGGHLVSSL
jgi:NAD(P)-dependent dehydrogenase (short-subunit alcohol dehydrogenase family)